jgi:hypothetical protein
MLNVFLLDLSWPTPSANNISLSFAFPVFFGGSAAVIGCPVRISGDEFAGSPPDPIGVEYGCPSQPDWHTETAVSVMKSMM